MATKKKEAAPAENAGEKTCPACGFVNPNEALFCGNCGKKLEMGKQCRNCGAPITGDSKFCMQCGHPTTEEKFCHMCGTKVNDDYKFCPKCGASSQGDQALSAGEGGPRAVGVVSQQSATPVQANAVPTQAPIQAPQPAPQRPKAPFRQRVVEYENKNHLLSNLVVLVMSFLFVFIALFAPVEVAINGFDSMGDDNNTVSEATGVDQSIFQVFDAYDYIGLNINDTYDKRLIDAMKTEFGSAMESAATSFAMWYMLHQDATEEEAADKLYEFLMDEMDDMNLLGFMLVLTTPGVYNSWSSDFGFEGDEKELGETLNAVYSSAVYSLVVATVIAVMQLAIAIMSLVFMIIAICNLVRKKPNKPFKYLLITLLLSGIGIMASMIAPNLIPGGAMLALCIMSTIAYIACAMTAYTQKNNYLVMIRRGVLAVLGMIIFFCMTANVLEVVSVTYEIGPGGVDLTTGTSYGSLGTAISGLFVFAFLYHKNGYKVEFSFTSASAMVFAVAVGLIATAVLFAMLICYLRALRKPDGKPTGRIGTWLAIAGAACLLVLAIGSPIIYNMGEVPASSATTQVYMKLGAFAAAAVFASVAFVVIATVFDFVYSATALKKPPKQAAIAAQGGEAAVAPAPVDSVSANESEVAQPAESPWQPPENQ